MNKKWQVNLGMEYYFEGTKLIFIERSMRGFGTKPTRKGMKEEILYKDLS